MYKNKSHCLVCGKEISYVSKRCQKHANEYSMKKRIKNRRNYYGKNNPNFGNHKFMKDKSWSWKGGKAKCKICNKLLSGYKYIYCSKHKGIKSLNPNWHGGISYLPYSYEWKIIRKEIRKFYNYICQLCFKKGKIVHHIDYNKQSSKINNLINLCKKCHAKTNGNRDYWYAYFRYIKDYENSNTRR